MKTLHKGEYHNMSQTQIEFLQRCLDMMNIHQTKQKSHVYKTVSQILYYNQYDLHGQRFIRGELLTYYNKRVNKHTDKLIHYLKNFHTREFTSLILNRSNRYRFGKVLNPKTGDIEIIEYEHSRLTRHSMLVDDIFPKFEQPETWKFL